MMSSDLHPPNLNADLYKVYQGVNTHRILNFIDVHADGSTLVGASDQNGRYWEGMVDFADSPRKFLTNVEENVMSTAMENSVTDGCFLSDSSKMVVCDDKGDLRIWMKGLIWSEISGTGNEQETWSAASGCSDHDDAILAVDLFPGEDVAVTGGADNCIKIWDLTNMIPTVSYGPAHTYIVSDVACNPHLQNVFLSSSLDGSVALWNTKSTQKRANVYLGPACAARCVCWLSDHVFAVGYDNGEIKIFDSRSTISESNLFSLKRDFPIDKMEFNEESSMLAVSGDSNTVSVYEYGSKSDIKLVFQDSNHLEYVRGLSWDKTSKGILYSCGWDDKVLMHPVIVH